MKSEYCKKCGHKNIYSINPPKFCSNCGEALDSNSPTHHKQTTTKATKTPRLLDDETWVNELPNIDKLSYEISHDQANSFTLGSLFKGKLEGLAEEGENSKRDDGE
jgi:hypothetical protein